MLSTRLTLFDKLVREKKFVELQFLVTNLKDQQTKRGLQRQVDLESTRQKPLDAIMDNFPEERQQSLRTLSELLSRHGHAVSEREDELY